uniref:Serine/threonine specific protein phosphatases domain-containing protein n=1 Tax=Setaria digitata TaxID=48799 RepID=A0A915Q6U0_9BILA
MILRQLMATCSPFDYDKIDELILKFLENSKMDIECLLTPQHFIYVCHKACSELRQYGSLVHVHCSDGVYVIGDLNGSFWDLIILLRSIGLPITRPVIFLGNYIDDVPLALHTIMFLLLLKIRFSQRIILLRGKHELWEVNKNFELHKEVGNFKLLCEKFQEQGKIMFYNLNEVFDSMPLAAIISDQIYCCHGGISQFAEYRSHIANIPRRSLWPDDISGHMMRCIFTDTIWAEPHFKQTMQYTPSDCHYSYYFNKIALLTKLCQLKCRALICGMSKSPNNISLCTNENEHDGCEEFFEGLCYALYSSHIARKRHFKAAKLLFKFNYSTLQVDAEVQYHFFDERKIPEIFENVKTEWDNFRQNFPINANLTYLSCENCAKWQQGVDMKSLQNNRSLSHPEMLHIMMKSNDPLVAEKYVGMITDMVIPELINFASAHAFAFFLHDLLSTSKVINKELTVLYREVERSPYSFAWKLPEALNFGPKLIVTKKKKLSRRSNSLYN